MISSLRFGAGSVELPMPPGLRVLRPAVLRPPGLRHAGPHGAESLPEVAQHTGGEFTQDALLELQAAGFGAALRGRRFGILIADATRPAWPVAERRALLKACEGALELSIFLCTGTHDPETPQNGERVREWQADLSLAGPSVRRAEVHVHDVRGEHELLGHTALGTPVEVDVRLSRCEVLLVLADMRPHYFAGYSNPTKYFVPGLASLEAVRANHRLALHPLAGPGRHPLHPDPERRENPLAADLLEASRRVVGERPGFAIAQVGPQGGAGNGWQGGGRLEEVLVRGICAVDRLQGRSALPAGHVIVGAGGLPFDESLYTAQRALEACREVIAPGARVLFVAECSRGIGPALAQQNFIEPLRAFGPPHAAPESGAGSVQAFAEAVGRDYKMYAHKAVKFVELLAHCSEIAMYSKLPPALLESIHLRPVEDLAGYLAEYADAGRVLVCEHASERVFRSRSRNT